MKPFPSLSNTRKASLISSSISEAENSLPGLTIKDCLTSSLLLSPGHQPDELVEVDVPVAVLVDNVDHLLELLLQGTPAEGPHDSLEGRNVSHSSLNTTLLASNSSAPMDPPPSRSKKEKISRNSFNLSGDNCSIAWNF